MNSRLHSRLFFMLLEWLLTMGLSSGLKTGYYNGYNFTVSESLNKIDAQNWCRTNRMILVEITSNDVQYAMGSFLDNNYNSGSVTTGGIRNNLQSWRRLNGSDTGSLSINGKSDTTYLYAYLTISTAYTITAARSTDQKNGYLCEGETNCPGSNGFVVDSWCYTAYAYGNSWSLSWFDARIQCINKGGDLASFYPITNNQQLNRLNGSWLNPLYSYWIGFRYESWSWDISGIEMKYTNWASGQPAQYSNGDRYNCMCVDPSQDKWQTCRCEDNSAFVCYSGSQTSTSTSTTTTTTTRTTTATKTTTLSVSPGFGGASAATVFPSNGSSDGITRSSSDISSTSDHTKDGGITPHAETSQGDQTQAIAIGVGVGVGVGIVIVALVIVVVVIKYRRCPTTCLGDCKTRLSKQPKQKNLAPPDLIALQTNDAGYDPYAIVVKPQNVVETETETEVKDGEIKQTVYAHLGFVQGANKSSRYSIDLPRNAGTRTDTLYPKQQSSEKEVRDTRGKEQDQDFTDDTRA